MSDASALSRPPVACQPARWTIKRNCSASPAQLALVFASVAALSFLIGVAFAAHGLWLVLPFVGVEMVAVAAAFLVYSRHAVDREQIELARGQLTVERHDGSVRRTWQWPAAWVRVELDDREQVFVAARGERVQIGRHLAADKRSDFARDLRRALLAAGS